MNLTQSHPTDHLLRLGFVVGLPPECLTNSKALLTCSDWRLRLSGYYLRLIWADRPFEITLFPSVGQVWEAMESGHIDLYLVGHPLDENLVRRLYPTAMLYRSVDVLFTRSPDVSISPENPFAFWLNLFARDTWICLLVFLLLLVLLHIFIERVTVGNVRKVTAVFRPSTPNQSRRSIDNRYDLTKKVFESCFLVFALLMAIYDSNAKAMLYTTNSKAPFVNLDDLAAQIRRGEKRMVLERRDTDRWRMLNNPNETDYASIKNLRNAVVETEQRYLSVMFQSPPNPDDSRTNDMVKKYYRACMNVDVAEKLGIAPLRALIDRYGGWPIVRGPSWTGNSSGGQQGYEWIEMAARTLRDFGLSRILLFSIKDDYKNSSKRVLEADQPRLGLGKRDYYLNANYSSNLAAYRMYIIATAMRLGAEESVAKRDTEAIIEFETKLANITIKAEDRRNFTQLYNPMTIATLKRQYPKIPFEKWLISMRENEWPISDEQIIDVAGAPYMKELTDVLATVDARTLANYQLLAPVLAMVPYLAPSLREHYKAFRKALYGTKDFKPRWEECIMTVREDLDWPVSSMYVKEYFKSDAKREVESIVTFLKQAMKQTIQEAAWMDGETKLKAQEKLEKIAKKIAYPDYIFNESKILQDFNGVTIDEMSYFESALSTFKVSFNHDRRVLHEFHDRNDWDRGPAIVNAFYWPEQNSITFPAGILQNPFFILSAPRYVNYGRIGSVIGHEITHGYDDQGRQFDGQGNLDLWWSNQTLTKYQAGTKCFIDQYSNLKDEVTGLNLNGELEVGENIADNGGIRLAYKAYQAWKAQQTFREASLPDLTGFTSDQMLFISYAQQWCDVIRPTFRARLIITDPHAPMNFRVNVPLQNFPAFAEAFKCPKGSPMNPADTCVIW